MVGLLCCACMRLLGRTWYAYKQGGGGVKNTTWCTRAFTEEIVGKPAAVGCLIACKLAGKYRIQWRIQELSHGGAWSSKTPKLVITTRSRRGPALAPSRGSGGMLPREILKIGMRRYAFFTILGSNFRKNQRANLQGNLYIYLQFLQNIWSHWEDQKKDVQHEENHASNGRPSNILLGCLCPYVVTTSSKSKCMSLWTLTGAAVHSSAPQTSCCGGLTLLLLLLFY